MSIIEVIQKVWHYDDALEQNYRLGSYPYRCAREELEQNGKLERVIKSTLVFQIIRLKDYSYLWRKGPKKRKGRWHWKKGKSTNQLVDYFSQEEENDDN